MTEASTENHFTANDGLRLYRRCWRAQGETKASVCLVHGLSEHSGRYQHVARRLTEHGYAVAAYDLRGQGRSAGKRVYIDSFEQHLDDLDGFLRQIGEKAGRPMFLLGHSMGGTIATYYVLTRAAENAFAGLALSGAALQPGEDIPPAVIRVARWLGRVLPHWPIRRIETDAISRDPEVVRRYRQDPLVHQGAIPARTGAELLKAIDVIGQRMDALRLPVLIMHGTADRLAAAQGSRQLYARAASTDKTLKLYPGLFHEIFNEPEWEQVLDDLIDWLDSLTGHA